MWSEQTQPEKVPGWDTKEDRIDQETVKRLIWELENEMHEKAKWLEFEEAAKLRDKIKQWKKVLSERYLTLQEDTNARQKMDQGKSGKTTGSARKKKST
jgi:excinuclease UvrABC nuclease subunit